MIVDTTVATVKPEPADLTPQGRAALESFQALGRVIEDLDNNLKPAALKDFVVTLTYPRLHALAAALDEARHALKVAASLVDDEIGEREFWGTVDA